jgi:hypothetical protein
MVDGVLYDKLESIARSVRESELPFGGIQVSLYLTYYRAEHYVM